MRGHSRRAFLQTASGAAALGAAGALLRASPAPAGPGASSAQIPAPGTRPRQADARVAAVLTEFDYQDVRLTGGPLQEQYDHMHAHYLALDNDRLLKVYRQHAGLPAPGKDMGGWYDADGFIPGHSLGQYISGLARIGRCTGDAACHAKVRQLVQGFGAVCETGCSPYAGPGAERVWPAYVMDKHAIGLIDAYRCSGFEPARALLPQVIAGCLPFVSPVSRDRVGKKDPPYDETYVLPENLFTAHEITGESRWRDLAVHYLLDREYFDPLAAGENVLPGRHAYSHAIALSSAAKAYFVLGDTRYRAALINAWGFLGPQRYASGGFGPDEQFITPGRGALFDSLARTRDHFETPCGSYAAMKLARYLLRVTGDARYGDGLERIVYNALLAVKPPDSDGDYPYYSTYGVHAVKEHYPHKWPCCSGTLVQGVADYVLGIYFRTSRGIHVNLFVPSEVSWRHGGSTVRLRQETAYPAEELTTIQVETDSPTRFTLGLRIPGWLRSAPEIHVNGARQHVTAQPGTFARVERTWKSGDRIELRLPQQLRTEAIDELHPRTVALLRGPVVYAQLDSTASTDEPPALVTGALTLAGGTRDVYVQNVAGAQTVWLPFYRIHNESYNLYVTT